LEVVKRQDLFGKGSKLLVVDVVVAYCQSPSTLPGELR
jgi:hypothetical protein